MVPSPIPGVPDSFVFSDQDARCWTFTIVVLVSGLSLWLKERQVPAEQLFPETDSAQKIVPAPPARQYHAERK